MCSHTSTNRSVWTPELKKIFFYSLSFFFLSLHLRQTVLFFSLTLSFFSLSTEIILSLTHHVDWTQIEREVIQEKEATHDSNPRWQSKTVTHHDGNPSSQIHNHLSLLISFLLKDLVFFFLNYSQFWNLKFVGGFRWFWLWLWLWFVAANVIVGGDQLARSWTWVSIKLYFAPLNNIFDIFKSYKKNTGPTTKLKPKQHPKQTHVKKKKN